MKLNIKIFFISTAVIFVLFEAWYFLLRQHNSLPPMQTSSAIFEKYNQIKSFDSLHNTAPNDMLPLNLVKGYWSFIFVGYTSCPDVCPLTLSVLASAFNKIEQTASAQNAVRGIFLSIDSQNDTSEKVMNFAQKFNKKIFGYRSSNEETLRFTKWLGAGFSLDKGNISHSTSLYLVSPAGSLVGEFINPENSDEIKNEFLKIKSEWGKEVIAREFKIQAYGPSAQVLTGYLDIENNLDSSIIIERIQCSDFEKIEMHEMIIDKSKRMMSMKKLEKLEVLANSKYSFHSKSSHLMMYWPSDRPLDINKSITCEILLNSKNSLKVYGKIEQMIL